jgi:spermidine/putrescine ABC transporter ATP-binding subunit
VNISANAALASAAASVPASSPLLEIRSISKQFGAHSVLQGISLDIAAAEFITLLGESGSGKTTLLRLIAGFEQPTSGEIWMRGARLDTLPPHRRKVNTVFQNYALFPHLSVSENVGYGLRVGGVSRCETASRVGQVLTMVKMQDFADVKPSRLSGGQQQRVALARALVNRPELLLLDEPLSALDANLRKQMQSELKSLQREVGITFLFVTHDQEEAMALSDRIALLRDGKLEQVATPREIYTCPTTAYTARFIGQTNLLRGDVRNSHAICGPLQIAPVSGPDGPTQFSLRPECIHLDSEAHSLNNPVRFRAVIQQQLYTGATEVLELRCRDGLLLRARIRAGIGTDPTAPGSEHEFIFSADDVVRLRG